MTREGVDYAWTHPDPGALAAAGITFACRYLSHDPAKNLTRAEVDALRAHAIDVVLNWESTSGRALEGHDAGAADGRDASAQAAALGAPPGTMIYFSVDLDLQPSQFQPVREYVAGVRSTIGGHAVGVYGGYACVEMLVAAGLVDGVWQTYAWSGNRVHPATAIYQYQNDVTIAGASCDRDRALREPFGQWGATNSVSNDLDMVLTMVGGSI